MPDATTALARIGVRGGAATGLAEELAQDEQPLGAIKATAEDDMTAGTLLLTDRRLVFFKKGLRKQRRESMRLADIQAVEITGMLSKKLELKIGGRTLKYDTDTIMGTNLNPKGFVDAVHRAVATARSGGQPQPAGQAPSPDRDPIADLERLVALRERGALTEEEFSAAKRTLLGM
jgi:hypothetical protein